MRSSFRSAMCVLLVTDSSLLKEFRLIRTDGFYKHPAPNGATQREPFHTTECLDSGSLGIHDHDLGMDGPALAVIDSHRDQLAILVAQAHCLTTRPRRTICSFELKIDPVDNPARGVRS